MGRIYYVCTPSEIPLEDKVNKPSYVYRRRFVRMPLVAIQQERRLFEGWAALEGYVLFDTARVIDQNNGSVCVYDATGVAPCVVFLPEALFDTLRAEGLVKSEKDADPSPTVEQARKLYVAPAIEQSGHFRGVEFSPQDEALPAGWKLVEHPSYPEGQYYEHATARWLALGIKPYPAWVGFSTRHKTWLYGVPDGGTDRAGSKAEAMALAAPDVRVETKE